MRRVFSRPFWWRLAGAVVCGTALLTGCDSETQAALEDGVISTSTSFVGALLQAWIEVAAAHAT